MRFVTKVIKIAQKWGNHYKITQVGNLPNLLTTKKKDSGEPELRQITKLTLHLLLLDNTFSSKLNLNDELQRQEIFRQSEQ